MAFYLGSTCAALSLVLLFFLPRNPKKIGLTIFGLAVVGAICQMALAR